MKEDREYWLAFSVCPGIGPKKFELLLKEFETAKNAWNASSEDIKQMIGQAEAAKLNKFKFQFSIQNYIHCLGTTKLPL